MGLVRTFLFIVCLSCITFTYAQTQVTSATTTRGSVKDTTFSTNQLLTLRGCIDYALLHQPALNRSLININITKETNAVNLSTLLPQVSASGQFVHYLQQPNVNS